MVLTKEERKKRYQGFSLSTNLIDEIKKQIANDTNHSSVTDFVREAVNEKLDHEINFDRMFDKLIDSLNEMQNAAFSMSNHDIRFKEVNKMLSDMKNKFRSWGYTIEETEIPLELTEYLRKHNMTFSEWTHKQFEKSIQKEKKNKSLKNGFRG